VLGVLGDYGTEWPARTHRFRAWTWGAVGLERTDRLTPFTWAASWTPPEAVAASIAAKPPGDRVLFFFANISNSMATHDDDACVGQDESGEFLTEFRSPWIDNGFTQVQSDITEFMTQFAAAGGDCDAVVLDNEHTFHYAQLMDGDRVHFQAIMDDPRFPTLEEELGFSDLTQIGWGNELSRTWDAVLIPKFDDAMNQAVFQPVMEQFPNAVTTNYSNQIISPENTTVGIAGHPKLRNGTGVGSHVSMPFYPRISQGCAQARPDGIHPVGGSDFAGFRLMVHWLRSIQASDSRPIMPWITNLSWEGDSDVFVNVIADSPYWSEMVLHMGVAGVDRFLYWTNQNQFIDPPNHNNPVSEQQLLADLLSELETRIGVDSAPLSLGRHSFGDRVIASGVQVGSRVLWRFSFDLGLDEVLVQFEDGGSELVQAELERPGAWFEHDATRPLVLTDVGIPDVN